MYVLNGIIPELNWTLGDIDDILGAILSNP